MQVKRHILLTGAGFTKNFGGFLADEMWGHIFNEPLVQRSKNLREEMLRFSLNFDFENAYDRIVNRKLPDAGYFTNALNNAYKKMDQSILSLERRSIGTPTAKIFSNLGKFLKLFAGNDHENKKGFIFTLNQDWIIERFDGDREDGSGHFIYPEGIDTPSLSNRRTQPFLESDFYTVPKDVRAGIDSHHSFYVKLHGSFHWKTKDGNGFIMLIGNHKDPDKSVLLKKYWNLFKEVIMTRKDLRLLIIGYRFQDEHINKALIEAMKNGLKIYIISPTPIREFNESFQDALCVRKKIFAGLSGYFNYPFSELLHSETFESSAQFKDLKKCFFDE